MTAIKSLFDNPFWTTLVWNFKREKLVTSAMVHINPKLNHWAIADQELIKEGL